MLVWCGTVYALTHGMVVLYALVIWCGATKALFQYGAGIQYEYNPYCDAPPFLALFFVKLSYISDLALIPF